MDDREDVLRAADRLFLSRFCDLWLRGAAFTGRRSHTSHWEPAFCVLPSGSASTGKAERVDGGLW